MRGIPTGNWRTTILILIAIGLLVAEGAWIYTPLADIELTPMIRILLTVAAAIAVALAGLFALLYERNLARREAAHRQAVADLEAARTGLFTTIAFGLDKRLEAIASETHRLQQDRQLLTVHGNEVATIDYNTERLRRFASDVRDVIALSSGPLPLKIDNVDLRDIVLDAARVSGRLAAHHQVDFKVHCEASLPVRADAARLTQVLNDMVRNAFHFTAPGGTVHLIGGTNENSARVTVQDSGRGLTTEEVPRLFQPFGRVHGAGESREPGTGLALYVAKAIMDAHGGRIWAESQGRGKGSRFTFELPLHARPFDIRNAPPVPSGTPRLPPAVDKAQRDAVR